MGMKTKKWNRLEVSYEARIALSSHNHAIYFICLQRLTNLILADTYRDRNSLKKKVFLFFLSHRYGDWERGDREIWVLGEGG